MVVLRSIVISAHKDAVFTRTLKDHLIICNDLIDLSNMPYIPDFKFWQEKKKKSLIP